MLEEQTFDSPYIYSKWHAWPDKDGVYPGVAMEYWTFFFKKEAETVQITIAPPHTKVRRINYKAGGEYWGILLRAHSFMPWLSKGDISNEGIALQIIGGKNVLVNNQELSIPRYEEAETFIEQLVSRGLIVANPLVAKALEGRANLPLRTIQRHVLQIAGLTRRELQHIRKARYAYALLQEGMPIADVALEAGYTDQSHLTKSLKLLAGETPAQILAAYKRQGKSGA